MLHSQIGIQLYTFRDQVAAEGLLPVLSKVADLGYEAVEFAGVGEEKPATVARHLADHGLRTAACHVPGSRWEDSAQGVMEELSELGATWAVVPALPTPPSPEASSRWSAVTRDEVKDAASRMNEWSALCRERGFRFAYHNHSFEFADRGGWTIWDVLVEELDEGLVSFEVDLYWVARAGHDPRGLLSSLGDRVRLLHLKDVDGSSETRDSAVGDGTLDWRQIVATAREHDVEWFIVEQEAPVADIYRDAGRSHTFLAALSGA